MTKNPEPEQIGLLFVHGIGEQEQWVHLHDSVLELAELFRHSDDVSSVTIDDRTPSLKEASGRFDCTQSPITMDVRMVTKTARRYECFEVWWADLGSGSGPLDSWKFWLWGLGQWCAPIYRELDASRLALPPPEVRGPLSKLPRSVVGQPLEVWVRLQLFLAAITAAFVLCTWSLAKRVFAALLGKSPSPTLIVQYVGDVRTFTERAAPGDSALTDPGFPRRVGIRRRMVSEMVALASREEIKEWYVLAHSLGTVVAYNGLTEIGHALPNYLTEEQWARVPANWKRDAKTGKRNPDDLGGMMPARPLWLEYEDVIDRRRLFEKLRGFLTYGSPLDKFAGLWPRIVATATDRETRFSGEFRWVNLHAPTDPVAGSIDCYADIRGAPTPINIRSRWSIWAGLEHVRYFKGFERWKKDYKAQRVAVANWLLGRESEAIEDRESGTGEARLAAGIWYFLLILLLWAITTAIIVLAIRAWNEAAGDGARSAFFDPAVLQAEIWAALGPVAGAFIAPIFVIGTLRWTRESWLNLKLATTDDLAPKVIAMLRRNAIVATILTILTTPLVLLGLPHDLGIEVDWAHELLEWLVGAGIAHGWLTAALSLTGLLAATVVQMAVNSSDP